MTTRSCVLILCALLIRAPALVSAEQPTASSTPLAPAEDETRPGRGSVTLVQNARLFAWLVARNMGQQQHTLTASPTATQSPPTATPTGTPSPTPALVPSTATPTATSSPTSTPTARPAAEQFVNGGFEPGARAGWAEYSNYGNVIVRRGDCLNPSVVPHQRAWPAALFANAGSMDSQPGQSVLTARGYLPGQKLSIVLQGSSLSDGGASIIYLDDISIMTGVAMEQP